MASGIEPFTVGCALAAAEIHAQGQPHTFLTGLGTAFLTTLYAEMAASPHCFGFVAREPETAAGGGSIVGFTIGTLDATAVFKDLIWRRGFRLALPVSASLLRRPGLIPNVVETLLYPSRLESEPGEAELFFIGTRADRRGEGIGTALFSALVNCCKQRGMTAMGLTVDDSSDVAKRFYRAQGMHDTRSFTLYGRQMHWYRMDLRDEE